MDLLSLAALMGLAASIVAILATLAVERFGGAIGGVLATVPTTITTAAAGWAYRLSAPELAQACAAVPVGQLIDGLFLLVWRYLPSHLPKSWPFYAQLATVTLSSLAVWFVLAAIYIGVRASVVSDVASATAIGIAAVTITTIVGAMSCINLPPSPPKVSGRPSAAILFARGLMAAIAIGAAVVIGDTNQVAGGVASTFPAIFLTVQVSLWLAHGTALPMSATGPMIMGSGSVSAYALLYGAIAPLLGPVGGAFATWPLAVLIISVPSHYFIQWRKRVCAASAGAEEQKAGGSDAAAHSPGDVASPVSDSDSVPIGVADFAPPGGAAATDKGAVELLPAR